MSLICCRLFSATTSKPSRTVGKTGKDTEVDKTTCGLYKADATEERTVPTSGVNQLPASTFLIPVPPKSIPTSSSTVDISQSKSADSTAPVSAGVSNYGNPNSSILLNHLTQPTNKQPECKVSYAYPMPVSSLKPEKSSQSYLILRKISEPGGNRGRGRSSSFDEQRTTSSIFEYQQSSSTGYNDHDQSEIKSITVGEYAQSSSGRQFSGKYKVNGSEDTTEKTGGKQHSKLSINQLRPSGQSTVFVPLHSIINDVEKIVEPTSAVAVTVGRSSPQGQPKSNIYNALFPSNNQPNTVTDSFGDVENTVAEQRAELERRSRLQYSSSSNIVEYVKLEEAHLPAPLRPNLVRRSVDAIDAILKRNREKSGDVQSRTGPVPARLQPNLARKSVDAIDALLKKNREKSGKFMISVNKSRNEVRRNSSDVRSDYTRFEDFHNENLRSPLDLNAVEKKYSGNNEDENMKMVYRRDNETSSAGPCASKTELLHRSLTAALRSKERLFPNDVKPEIERQDLPINESEVVNRDDINLKDKVNAVIKRVTLSQESKDKLGIDAVSTENMKVLEQFESAMLEVDGDETANC